MAVEARLSVGGQHDDWVQAIRIPFGGTVPGIFQPDPSVGRLELSYINAQGVQKWWNGSAFTTAPFTLATTLDHQARVSRYTWIHPQETWGLTTTFRGWINDDLTTEHTVIVSVAVPAPANYAIRG